MFIFYHDASQRLTQKQEPPSPPSSAKHPARYSIAYFCNPDFEKTIATIPNTVPEGEAPKYTSVNSGEYLVKRLSATY